MNWNRYPHKKPLPEIEVFIINHDNSIDVGSMTNHGYWGTKAGDGIPDPILWAYVDVVEAVKNASE